MTETLLQVEVEAFVKSRKILKKDFAKMIEVTPVMLSHWLKGRVTFNRATLQRIVALLDMKEC